MKSIRSFFTQTLPLGIFLALSFLITVPFGQIAHAETAADFNPGQIIADNVFTNSASMSAGQIQNFLNAKVPSCDTQGTQTASDFGSTLTHAQYAASRGWPGPPYTCLKDYSENGLSSAQIIYNVSQQYVINPQVLIVLLQKEQGLVTDSWPLSSQYKTATGYGCPDTAACDSQYFGLTNQLTWAGKMFRAILNNSSTWYSPYILGNNTIQWNPSSSCGSSTVFIQNRATQALYDYTPYRPNQAALNAGYGMGDSCSSYGNRNFYLYFRDWFGYNAGPAAFTVAGSSTVYVPVEGYKLTVPFSALMQDYGISLDAVQTVSQAYADSIPPPTVDSGISSAISYVVKSPSDSDEDGASVYLISRGIRYQFQSMQQFYNLGFTDQDISYLPLDYIFTKTDGGFLPYFFQSPYGTVFKLDGSVKRPIFEYSTYIAQNPSDQIALFSYYLADKVPSGNPITSRPVLIQFSNSGVDLYANSNYYSIPTYGVFNCWGLDGAQGIPTYRLPQDNYIQQPVSVTAPLSCVINDNGSTELMNVTSRITAPTGFSVTPATLDSTLQSIATNLPLRQTSLKQYVMTPTNPAVYSVENSTAKVIPTFTSYQLLGLNTSSVDVVSPGVINAIPYGGIKLANGQLVKSSNSSAVFTIANGERVLYPTSSFFTDYGNSWNTIATIDSAALDQAYPYNNHVIGNYLVDKQHSQAYIVADNGCFSLSSSDLTRFGTSLSALTTAQSYDIDSTRSVSLNCSSSTAFIKQADSSLVYWVNNGQKQALTTYAAMLSQNGGTAPTVMVVSPGFIQSLPTAS